MVVYVLTAQSDVSLPYNINVRYSYHVRSDNPGSLCWTTCMCVGRCLFYWVDFYPCYFLYKILFIVQ